MNGRVDERSGEVVVAERRWPFTLDCRQGSATVELGGRGYLVRAQSWRHRRVLARFAHLDPRFLREEFVRLCLPPECALPEQEVEREVLWTLARWINAPGPRPALALDPGVLATVTLQVCQALQARPRDLDDVDASDVELLWQAARAAAPAPAAQAEAEGEAEGEPSLGTRIVIVPDPVAPAETAAPGEPVAATTRERSDPSVVAPRSAPAQERPAAGAPAASTRAATPAAMRSVSMPERRSAEPGQDVARERSPIGPETSPARNGSLESPASPARFRVTMSATATQAPCPAPASGPHPGRRAERLRPPLPAAGVALAAGLAPAAGVAPPDRAALIERRAPVEALEQPRALAVAPLSSRQLVAPLEVRPAAREVTPPSPEELFDELALRLAQAAGELGIDVEL